MAERSKFIIRCSMFDVGRSKECFNLLLTSIFYSRRNGRTFPGPPIESVGLDQTKLALDHDFPKTAVLHPRTPWTSPWDGVRDGLSNLHPLADVRWYPLSPDRPVGGEDADHPRKNQPDPMHILSRARQRY